MWGKSYWDPLSSDDWDAAGPPNHFVSTRIKRDLTALFKEPLPGIFAIPDEKNFCLVHCLIVGPMETPYERGFFHFAVRFGPSYPIHPPRVRLLTTGGGKVRFNPNLYENGKVCLSILGTFSGPAWSPALNLGSVLLSIQSLLNDEPYYNEPLFFKKERYIGESDKYNIFIIHETIRISICTQLEHYYCDKRKEKMIPAELAEVMKENFLDFYSDYIDTCNKFKVLDGQDMTDIFKRREPLVYSFDKLITRLKGLKEVLSALKKETKEKDKDSSLSSISDEDEHDNKACNTKSCLVSGTPKNLDTKDDVFEEPYYDGNDDVDFFCNDDDEEVDEEGEEEEELKEVSKNMESEELPQKVELSDNKENEATVTQKKKKKRRKKKNEE